MISCFVATANTAFAKAFQRRVDGSSDFDAKSANRRG